MPISPRLTSYLQDFANRLPNGTSSTAYTSILAALNGSPLLLQEAELAALDKFAKFDFIVTPTGKAAAYDSSGGGTILIAVDSAGNLTQQGMGTFVLVLGHEVKHANRTETYEATRKSFNDGVADLAGKPGMQEYTRLLLTSQSDSAYDEAVAHITGWNDLVSYVRHSNPSATLEQVKNEALGYSQHFLKPGTTIPVSGLTLNDNLTISIEPQNVAAVATTFFYNPATRFEYGLTYPEYYTTHDLKKIVQTAAPGKVALDFAALKLDPAKLQSFNSMNLGSGDVRSIYDPVSLTNYEFKGTANGVTRSESKPVSSAGEKWEILHFDESGSYLKIEHKWSINGEVGHDIQYPDGSYEMETRITSTGEIEREHFDAGSGLLLMHSETGGGDGSDFILNEDGDELVTRNYSLNDDGMIDTEVILFQLDDGYVMRSYTASAHTGSLRLVDDDLQLLYTIDAADNIALSIVELDPASGLVSHRVSIYGNALTNVFNSVESFENGLESTIVYQTYSGAPDFQLEYFEPVYEGLPQVSQIHTFAQANLWFENIFSSV